ncbi:MAG: hypothetical protein PHX51_05065 [Clostridia bacterium]|nr:hypothetical protein [Clostridia bacterium]
MILKDVIELSAVFCNRTKLMETGVFLQTSSNALVADVLNSDADLGRLIECANIILREMASDYLPLEVSEEVSATNGVIYFSALSKNIYEPLKLEKNGIGAPYKVYGDCIKAQSGDYTLSYLYLPSNKSLFDTVDCSVKASDRLIAYGTAAEYFTQNGLYEEAKLFDKRYKEGLLNCSRYRRSQRLPQMRWI